jgi:Tol biopolymer transport system component
MSPEQAKGRAADKRSDIWAFGCVLYEMLTSTRAFAGDDVSEVLASVLAREPNWARLPSNLPPALGTYLRRCLHKNPKQRIADVQDIRLALEGAFESMDSQPASPVTVPLWRRIALAGFVALLGGGVAAMLMWFALRAAEPSAPRVAHLPIAFSTSTALSVSGSDHDLAITPDGSRVVYVGNNGTQLFVRALDTVDTLGVFTGAPAGPFASPDGRWIGFTDGSNVLKKVAVAGGAAITLATVDGVPRGETWARDDTIIFATNNTATGLQRVSAAGGMPDVLTRPDRAAGELDHLWPELLPGGYAVLFTVTMRTGGLDAAQVVAQELQTGKRTVLVRGGTHARYVPGGPGSPRRAGPEEGYLVYAAAGTLRAVAFDLARLKTQGTPVPVVSDVTTNRAGGVDAVVAGDGTLAYVSGGVADLGRPRTLVWVDRQGRETPIPAPPRAYVFPRLSPDGQRIAVYAQDQEADIWLWDPSRKKLDQVTFGPGYKLFPLWTPDGRRLIFSSARAGPQNLFWQAADGTGDVDQLTSSPNTQASTAVTPDGLRLIFTETFPNTGDDVMQMMLDGTHRVTPLVQSPFVERNGVVSPDGRWLAYEANDAGPFEIYVRPFPDVNAGHWRVSTAGGTRPLWARFGQTQELFYVSPTGALMRAVVEHSPSWAASMPTLQIKEGGYLMSPLYSRGRTYDIAPDGQRFLMIKDGSGADAAAAPRNLVLVLNWVEELKRLVPTK